MKLKYLLLILIVILVIGIILIEKPSEQIKSQISNKLSKALYENGSFNVYFCPEEDCNTIMLDYMINSTKIECAFFELTDNRIQNLFIEKNASLIIHYENYKNFGYSRETDGLMHDKFCILDDKKIITGSHNPTNNKNKDNVLVIESKYLSDNYNHEFLNLQKYLAPEKEKTKNTKIIFNEYELDNYFCPQDSCQKQILAELYKANTSIYFLTYTFTDKDVANTLVGKKQSGLEVRGVIESYQGKTYWVYPTLISGNVPVVLDEEQTLQHNKVFIIDNKTVVTGSFNPTKSADTINDENVLIIRQPDVVKKYVDEFEHLYVALQE
jgi:phosphatidylserine/phosphatidylglycerophosphate/cardiolipin synthase-like enzyme